MFDIFANRLRQEQLRLAGNDVGRGLLLGEEAHRAVEPLRLAPTGIEREQERKRVELGMRAGLGRTEESAPNLDLGALRAALHAMDALRSDPSDLVGVGRTKPGATRQEV